MKRFGVVTDGELQGVKVHFTAGGKILVGSWEGNSLTGFASVFDPQGRLLYCGGLKEGRRNGQGTSFKEDGSIDCVGEWKNDVCHVNFYIKK